MAGQLSLNELLPFFHLHELLVEYVSEENISHETELNRLFLKFIDSFKDPNPFSPHKNKEFSSYPQEKNDIRINKHKDYPGIEFKKEQVEGILAMSNAYNLSEGECVRYFVASNRSDCRRMAESFAGLAPNSLENSFNDTALILYLFDNSKILDIVALLIKHRLSTSSVAANKSCRRLVVVTSNSWLAAGLITNIANVIRDSWLELMKESGNLNPAAAATQGYSQAALIRKFRVSCVQKLAESLFFVSLSTQVLPAEFSQIFDLMQSVSNSIIDSTPPSAFMKAVGVPVGDVVSAGGGTAVVALESADNWKRQGMELIVILQLTYAAILNQKSDFLQRSANEEPYHSGEGGKCVDLPCHVDSDRSEQPTKPGDVCWRSAGLRGFCFLVHASQLQQAVDVEKESADRVIRYLFEATQSRAFSYLRLVMVPVVVSMITGGSPSGEFYMEVVQDMLIDIAVLMDIYPICPDPHYPDPGFVGYVRSKKISQFRLSNPTCDCLDDIINLFAVVCSVWPPMALHFAKDSSDAVDFYSTVRGVDPNGNKRFLYHPVFNAFRLACFEDRAVMRAFVNLCRGVGAYNFSDNPRFKSMYGISTKAVYACLRSHEVAVGPPREDMSLWGFFVCFFSEFANQFRKKSALGGPDASQGLVNRGDGQGAAIPNQVLSQADVDFLVDIADLVATLGSCPEVATAMIRDCNPIPSLFSLVSCPVPIHLKGAIFRALAALAFAHQECHVEIWSEMELHHILHSSSMVSIQDRPDFAAHATASHDPRQHLHSHHHPHRRMASMGQQGLRSELERAESAAGVYPCTDGFLRLLEALLSHGIPTELGRGERLPGILPYVEFVLEDVLSRASSRHYAPAGPEGESQRWRITATCISILVLIVKQYGVNTLYHLETDNGVSTSNFSAEDIYRLFSKAGAVGGASTKQRQISELAADFFELPTSYTCLRSDGTAHDCRMSRLKSPGFVVMAMLLGGSSLSIGAGSAVNASHLLSFALNLLADCNISKLNASVDQIKAQVVDTAVSIFCVLQPPERPQLELLYGSNENLSGLSLLGSHSIHCDGSYWREKTVAACIGLLYECSLREFVFNHFIHRSSKPVFYTRFVNNRQMNVPVVTQSLALEIGASIQLGRIGHFLKLQDPRVDCYPSIPGMVACLLEHVASQLPAQVFRGAMKELDQDSNDLVAACISALHDSPHRSSHDLSLVGLSKVVLRSSDPRPVYIYSSSYLSTLQDPARSQKNSPAELSRWVLMNGGSDWNASDSVDSYSHWNNTRVDVDAPIAMHAVRHGCMSVEENVYGLLFASLSPGALSFAHYLLGIHDAIDCSLNGPMQAMGGSFHDIASHAATLIPDAKSKGGQPPTCLGAVLHEIMPQQGSQTASHLLADNPIIQRPSLAMLAYELIYKLCSYPISSNVILAYLRKRSINFLHIQLSMFAELCSLTDSDIRRLLGSSISASNMIDTAVENIKTTRNHCLAWILSILAIEIRVLVTANDVSVKKIGSLLNTVFFPTTNSSAIPLARFINTSLDLPPDQFTDVSSPFILQCFDKVSVKHKLNRLSRRPLAVSIREERDNDLFSAFSIVDISALTRLLEEAQLTTSIHATQSQNLTHREIVSAIQAATEMNLYQLRLASSTHLALGISQLVEVVVLEDVTARLLILGESLARETPKSLAAYAPSLQRFFDGTLMPLLCAIFGKNSESRTSQMYMNDGFLGTSVVEMIMAEKLMHAVVACVHGIRQVCEVPSIQFCPLSAPQHAALLQCFCHAIAPKGSSRSVVSLGRSRTSIYFRGLVYSALALILGNSSPSESFGFELSDVDEENESKALRANPDDIEEYSLSKAAQTSRQIHLEVLKLWAPDVMLTLMSDACVGPVIWRVMATTTAAMLLTSIHETGAGDSPETAYVGAGLGIATSGELPPITAAMISPTYAQALHASFEKNALQQLITIGLGPISLRAEDFETDQSESAQRECEDRALGLMGAVLTLCIEVAETVDGVRVLLQSKIFHRLLTLHHLATAIGAADDNDVNGSAKQMQEQHFSQCLCLLRVMLNTCSSIEVVTGVLQFFKKYRALVVHYLSLQFPSLVTIRVLKSLLSVLSAAALVKSSASSVSGAASRDQSPLKKSKSDPALNNIVGSGSLFELILGSDADVFTVEICLLLSRIGTCPIPGRLDASSNQNTWWESIQPLDSLEAQWATTLTSGPVGMQIDPIVARNWTHFDNVKLCAGLDILRHASVFLRIRADSWVAGGFNPCFGKGDHAPAENNVKKMMALSCLMSFDLHAIAETFRVCAKIVRVAGFGSVDGQLRSEWLQSSAAFISAGNASSRTNGSSELSAVDINWEKNNCQKCLGFIAENLLCVIHAFVVTGDSEDVKKWRIALLQLEANLIDGQTDKRSKGPLTVGTDIAGSLLEAEQMPPHSFMRLVARWIRGVLEV